MLGLHSLRLQLLAQGLCLYLDFLLSIPASIMSKMSRYCSRLMTIRLTYEELAENLKDQPIMASRV